MQKEKSKILTLFLTFLKIGAFTFGGGYAMIPLIQREIVLRRRWITDDDILEITAIAESTPGPIAVNSATFVGYRVGGLPGAALSTVGVVLPSFVIITAMARKLGKNILNIIIALAAFAFTGIFGFDVIPVLIACAVVGLTGSLAAAKRAEKKADGRDGK